MRGDAVPGAEGEPVVAEFAFVGLRGRLRQRDDARNGDDRGVDTLSSRMSPGVVEKRRIAG